MENKAFDHIRTVNYYETDKMGITHHSNYIRWMEEARTAFLNRHGCGYAWFESEGVVSPVLSVSCQYKHSSTFEDRININVSINGSTSTNSMPLVIPKAALKAKIVSLITKTIIPIVKNINICIPF